MFKGMKQWFAGEDKLSGKEMEDLAVLEPMIFSDYRDPLRGPYETVYVFSETKDNDYSALMKAVAMVDLNLAKSITICDGPTNTGYPGAEKSEVDLSAYGVNPSIEIRRLKVPGNVNTRSEADALVADVSARKGDIAIIAPPFHLTRAYMTAITALRAFEKAHGPQEKNIFAVSGEKQPWNEKAAHSQGTLEDTRVGLQRDGELPRLKRYQKPEGGNMLSPEKVIQYMLERDKRIYPHGK